MSRQLILVLVTLSPVAPVAGQADSLPEGVTPAMIATGRSLFHGQGLCFSCHGQDGQGVANLGPALGDPDWLHGDGSLAAIVARISAGVPADSAKTGISMPPLGGSRLNDTQVRAVAAYVWSLRRR